MGPAHGPGSLIIAGALGNLYDRLSFGAVRDFLVFQTQYFPFIFNVADSLLCVRRSAADAMLDPERRTQNPDFRIPGISL